MLQAKPKYSLQCQQSRPGQFAPYVEEPTCKKTSEPDNQFSATMNDYYYNGDLTVNNTLEKRKKLWSVSPSSFHQSFDDRLKPHLDVPECSTIEVSNSCGDINKQGRTTNRHQSRRPGFCPGDTGRGIPPLASHSRTLNPPPCSSSQHGASGGSTQNARTDLTWISAHEWSNSHAGSGFEGSCHRLATAATAAATSSPGVIEYVIRRKESWSPSPFTTERKPAIKTGNFNEGDGSISLISNISDVEQQKLHDDSKTPLMKEKEKGGRLIQRQRLFHVRRVTMLMVIENELTADLYQKSSFTSLFLRTLILLSTIVLVILVAKFHIHEVQLFMNANSAEDWRIAVTPKRFVRLVLELLACGICPLPINLSFEWITVHADGETVTRPVVPLDVLLSIPMFFAFTGMLLHSRLFTDASSRSIAGLNRVNFNARFILKTLMTLCPGTMLMVFTASLWVIAGWIMRLCERPHGGYDTPQATKHQNYLNSLWLIAITFLSVGYGDIVPNTYCGRIMAVVTGILGLAICALRKVKHDQRKLAENTVSLGDVAKTISSSYEIIHDIFSTQEGLALRITSVEHQLSDIQKELGGIAELLRASIRSNETNTGKNHGGSHNSSMSDSLRRRKHVMESN
uniref:Potassium channel domain-containing protein n=1 Tax=Ditylenchus dipsaci TaxID=166011 RepID=A0A915CZF9_9BILA